MEPKKWGPPGWKFLHSITFEYPEKPTNLDKEKYYTFFNSLKNVLPCPNCRIHYGQNLEKYPIKLETREELIHWLIDIHNEVNKLTGKRIYSYEEVYKEYDYGMDTGGKTNFNFLILLIVLLILGCYYYKNHYLKNN